MAVIHAIQAIHVRTGVIPFLCVVAVAGVAWAGDAPPRPKIAVVNFSPPSDPPANPTPTTLTVMSPEGGSSHQRWLSKAIADLLIQSLSRVGSLAILEREKMQTFVDEMQLGQSALFGQEHAVRLGRVARVEQVIFGRYDLNGDQITLRVHLMDLSTQKIVRTQTATAPLTDLRRLVGGLVVDLLSQQAVNLTDQQKHDVRFERSGSIAATEHFYRAIDRYDRGDYPGALSGFAMAHSRDRGYLEAALWLGRMFEHLGHDRHAAQAYRQLADRAPQSVEGLDARYFAAQLYQTRLADPAQAIEAYTRIIALAPHTPHALAALDRLGDLHATAGRHAQAYQAYRQIDAFQQRTAHRPDALTRGRPSRFVTRRHASRLSREAIVKMIDLYVAMLHDHDHHQDQNQDQNQDDPMAGKLPPPPRGLIVLDPDHPTVGANRLDEQPAVFASTHEAVGWRQRLYAVVVPKGYIATGVDLSVSGQLLEMRPYYAYAMRVLAWPLPRDPDRHWLGAIFGQTPRPSTLHKSVSFHGDHQRVLSIQLRESSARIDDWQITVRLRPVSVVTPNPGASIAAAPAAQPATGFWEGQPAGQVALPVSHDTGSARRSAEAYYRPKKEIDVVHRPGYGYLAVATVGGLDGQRTDLYATASADGRSWSAMTRLPVSGASDDLNPRLIRCERGEVWLAWVSTRRGEGWDLWLARWRGQNAWDPPRRVPFEKFFGDEGNEGHQGDDGGDGHEPNTPQGDRSRGLASPLEYDVFQDRQGRWIAVGYAAATRRIVFLTSRDLDGWRLLAGVGVASPAFGLSLTQDSAGAYRLGYLGGHGKIHLWRSNDARQWTTQQFSVRFWNQSFFPTPGTHRMRLLPLDNSQLLMLVSDNLYGLQYAKFHPDTQAPRLDLVSRAGLEAYGVTQAPLRGPAGNDASDTDDPSDTDTDADTENVMRDTPSRRTRSLTVAARDDPRDREYLVALKHGDRVGFRRYRRFNVNGQAIDKDTRHWPIYREVEADAHGHTWHRIFAQVRRIIPDVTSLGIDPDGRVWWGIESGVMYKQGDRFLATDVSQGFFHHLVTEITSSPNGRVWFSSKHLREPKLGTIHRPRPIDQTLRTGAPPRFETVRVPGVDGAITDAAAGLDGSQVYLGTSRGRVVGFDGDRLFFDQSFGSPVTAVAFDRVRRTLWVGTERSGVCRVKANQVTRYGRGGDDGLAGGAVLDLAIDARGVVWAAVSGQGLFSAVPCGQEAGAGPGAGPGPGAERWRNHSPGNSDVLYWNVGRIAADPQAGVWYLPHDEERSVGLGYFDGERGARYNPPHRILDRPSSLVVDPQGSVWVGTWFDGLYKLERKAVTP